MRTVPRILDWMFSSVTSSCEEAKTCFKLSRYAAISGSIGTVRRSTLRFFASAAALRRDPAPGVVETGAEDALEIDVHDHQVFLEGARLGQNLALRAIDATVAVEDQLVLTPDGVHECDHGDAVESPGGEHAVPGRGLAGVEGRRGEVDHQLRVAVHSERRGRAHGGADGLADG